MKKGQSLVEVLVAVGIAMMLGIALVSASVLTQKTSRSTQNTAYATKLAQELMEELRIYRDQSRDKLKAFQFYNGLAPGGGICVGVPNSGVGGTKNADGSLNVTPNPANGNLTWTFNQIGSSSTCPAVNDSWLSTVPANMETISSDNVQFFRYVLFVKDPSNPLPGNGMTGTVYVSWKEQSGWRTVSADVYLAKWCDPTTSVCL